MTCVNVNKWQTQHPEWNQLAQKSPHCRFLCLRKSTAGKANLRWPTLESGRGEGALLGEGHEGNSLGPWECFMFCFRWWLQRYIPLLKLRVNWTLKICGFHGTASTITPRIKHTNKHNAQHRARYIASAQKPLPHCSSKCFFPPKQIGQRIY